MKPRDTKSTCTPWIITTLVLVTVLDNSLFGILLVYLFLKILDFYVVTVDSRLLVHKILIAVLITVSCYTFYLNNYFIPNQNVPWFETDNEICENGDRGGRCYMEKIPDTRNLNLSYIDEYLIHDGIGLILLIIAGLFFNFYKIKSLQSDDDGK